jgi:hypothetical protein
VSTRRRRRTPPPLPGASPGRRPVRRPRRCHAPCTAPTHRHRPATASSPFPFSPAGEHLCRRPFSFPCCRREPWAADEPSVASRRTPLPLPASVPFLCRDPSRRPSTRSRRRPSAAATPLASPSPCRAHTHLRTDRHGRAYPHFWPQPSLASPRPRHSLAVRGDHTLAPRHRVRVAADSLGLFPEHQLDVRPRTRPRRPHARARTRLPHLSPTCQ